MKFFLQSHGLLDRHGRFPLYITKIQSRRAPMDFKTLLTNRRSVRNFQEKEVPLSVVEEILQDAFLAPTASNGQPCRFIVIRNRDLIKRLSDESKRNLLADIAGNTNAPLKMYEEALQNEGFNVFYNAPCLILIVGSREVRSLEIDCSLTAAYLMFSATARGLGTCWVALGADIRGGELLSEIGLPKGCAIVAPIILGYPESIPAASERHAPDIVRVV
jgi:nitroreductase